MPRAVPTSTPADAWEVDAACAEVDTDVFFPEKGHTAREAKRICAVCPVRSDCLANALARRERHGVWGGTTEDERRALLRRPQTRRAS